MNIIYILTNEAFPDYVKIGVTDRENVSQRAKELSTSGVPLPFEVFYARRVEKEGVERQVHEILDDYRVNPKREFFEISREKARLLLDLIDGEDVTPGVNSVEDKTDKEKIEKRAKGRERFNFDLVGIKPGATLQFAKNPEKTVVVTDNNRVQTDDGEVLSLSAAALRFLHEEGDKWKSAQGASFFEYEGETLESKRKSLESEDDD